MIATSPSREIAGNNLKDIQLINVTFEEYNVLLKNAKATICMSEFKEVGVVCYMRLLFMALQF